MFQGLRMFHIALRIRALSTMAGAVTIRLHALLLSQIKSLAVVLMDTRQMFYQPKVVFRQIFA
jgi:hypothetical protein